MTYGTSQNIGNRFTMRYWWVLPVLAHLLLLLLATYFPVMPHRLTGQVRPGYFWFQWDSLYYILVGKLGYTHIPGIFKYKDTAFFPFIPLLVRFLGAWTLLLLEQVTFAICIILLKDFGERVGLSRSNAIRAAWLFALCPTAIYFSSIYAEPWTIFGALVSLYFASRQRWLIAAAMGFITAMTQGTGILFGVFPLVLFFYSMLKQDFRMVRNSLIWGLGCALGLSVYMAYLAVRYHDPFLFSTIQTTLWYAHWVTPWYQVIHGLRVGGGRLLYEFITMIYCVGAIVMCTHRTPNNDAWENTGAKLYVVLGMLVSLCFYAGNAPFYSTMRLASIYFPAYMGLSKLPAWLFWPILVCFTGVAYLGASLFSHGQFFQ